MAIVPIMIPATGAVPVEPSTAATAPPTEDVAAKLESVSLQRAQTIETKAKPVRGTQVSLSVPLDAPRSKTSHPSPGQTTIVHGTRKLLRRDSLDRREAILRGKEGSRQRRRWENDRLLNNPHAEPPLPSDWEIRPTYPRRTIPYYLAPLWDAAEFQRAIESKLKGNRRNSTRHGRRKTGSTPTVYDTGMSPMEEAATSIPKEIRSRLKHARSAKGLLQDLEEDVRDFVRRWNERELSLRRDGLTDAPLHGVSTSAMSDGEEEDEEIVFVGRNGAMHDLPSSPSPATSLSHMSGTQHRHGEPPRGEEEGLVATEKLVFQAPDSDKGAGFARWLVHCVGSYYGLKTWSVTADVDGEPKRQAFVGVDARVRGFRGRCVDVGGGASEVELPRPLWGMV